MSFSPLYRPLSVILTRHSTFSGVLLAAFMFFPSGLWAQPVNSEIRVAVREDNRSVYIFHTALPPIGHGFNIYRRDENSDDFVQLNIDPVRGVASGAELRALLGTLYDDVEGATQQTTANGTLTRLRSDTKTANLLTFTYPQIADALGRLYIDDSAPAESPATYRIEFVDALDEPTGQTLEHTALLLPQKPDAPTRLRAQNQGNKITLFWRFITPSEGADDKVIRFDAYRIDPTTGQHQRLNDNVILRNNASFEYALTFETPTTGQTEQLYVRAIDISGQSSEPSQVLRYDALDLDPPRGIVDVNTSKLPNQRVQVSWTVSENDDVAGFNVYRSTALMNESAYVRLNQNLLSINETTFNDTLLSQEASQVYYYRITAVDASGNEGLMSTAAMAILQDRQAPPAPTNLAAERLNDGAVTVSWENEPVPDDFAGYILLRKPVGPHEPALPVRLNRGVLLEPSFVDPGIASLGFREGAVYRYSVMSVDQAGNFSDAVSYDLKIPDTTAPAAPNGTQAIVDTPSRIALFWNPSPATDVMSYLVYRREYGSTRVTAYPVPPQQRRFEDEQVTRGATYEYWVTAADSAGNESPRSEIVSIQMRDNTGPRIVRNVRVQTNDQAGLLVQWEPVSAFDLAGYQVYRADSQTGQYELVTMDLLLDTRWQDPDGQPGQWYRIFAVDTSGNQSAPSRPISALIASEQ